ncbi:MAG TPA: bifunctional DNA-formamidopyrimidine glycosylase/DNA-(apurinic or apyrimidinic site) lyase [Gammaproteobacteria bacterium]|jgi:formamidopyrimidine-DNA glycosylase
MPELPEVETTRRGLLPHLKNRTATDVRIRNRQLRWPIPRGLKQKITGQRIIDVRRRGKYLIFDFEQGHMLAHLGMSGSFRIVDVQAPARKHDHIDWLLDSGMILRFHDPRRFGSIHWVTGDILQHPLLKDLGPEPLEDEFNGGYLSNLARNRKIAVKNFIMNSRVVTGVGNIYASESLFLAGIHPDRPAGQVSQSGYQRLAEAVKTVLTASIEQGGTTLRDFVNENGNPGYFRQQLRVYEQAGNPCRQCGRAIQMQVIGQRSSYFCPRCQK